MATRAGPLPECAWLEGMVEAGFFEAAAFPVFDQLCNLAHWLTGDRTDAEGLVQETYAKALKVSSPSRKVQSLARGYMHREVGLLSDFEKLADKAISRMLGVPIVAVMSRLSRGRNLLKQTLAVHPARRLPHAV